MDHELIKCAKINFENFEESNPKAASDVIYKIAKRQLDQAIASEEKNKSALDNTEKNGYPENHEGENQS